MKTILAFETSCPYLSIALGNREGKIRELRTHKKLMHSENLIPLVHQLLKKEKINLDEIDAFAIDQGPGSFTGLRIGFSFLKGLLAAKKKPCYGGLSLDIIASKTPTARGSRLGVLIDARRDAIYSRFYHCRKGEWAAEGKLELVSLRELKEKTQPPVILAGDALVRYRAGLEEFDHRIHFINPEHSFPQAAVLVKWFQAKDRRLSPLKQSGDRVPLYFRATGAEENRERNKIPCQLKLLPSIPGH